MLEWDAWFNEKRLLGPGATCDRQSSNTCMICRNSPAWSSPDCYIKDR